MSCTGEMALGRLWSFTPVHEEPRREPRRHAVSEPLSDALLVERAARGDSIAFSELVTRHYRRAVRVSFGLMKNRQDAEDVVQDAFARVYKRLGTFEGDSSFYTWLYRIVVNQSIDALRRRRREKRVELDSEDTRAAEREGVQMWPRFEPSDPGESAERRELGAKLQRALDGLQEIHQAVILLRELEGFTYEEIAQTLGIRKGTVMSRLFHARKAMQRSLGAINKREAIVLEGNLGA